ncbi:hypothetical protein BU251_08360 [Candidatus Velamenicoccus archaeovorus]|uniref:Glycine zipper domain-containing protein n=2 Tax=Velamenicoccus archaeovorus TaxID=1930593 RepID=A0A410P6E9_VELA1|nr:hypothetical protein BU251_08360 [Candidatus Velamenicoccus archaeovorus]
MFHRGLAIEGKPFLCPYKECFVVLERRKPEGILLKSFFWWAILKDGKSLFVNCCQFLCPVQRRKGDNETLRPDLKVSLEELPWYRQPAFAGYARELVMPAALAASITMAVRDVAPPGQTEKDPRVVGLQGGNMQILKMVMSGVMAVALVLPLAGCDTMGENTKTGALGGALVGSVAGGVIGHQSGHGVEGALIGGTVGALGGGLIGHSIDQKRTKEQIMSGKEKLGISDVIVLAKSGMTDDAIIAKIAETGSVYNLSVEEITTLQKEGVSNRVINYMMTTAKK